MRRLPFSKPLDILALIVSVMTVVSASVFAFGNATEPSSVSIETEEARYLYPLDQDRVVTVGGPIGDTLVEIRGSRARVIESPCRDKICILAGHLDATGAWTACLPNRVFVRIEGDVTGDGVDAQTF